MGAQIDKNALREAMQAHYECEGTPEDSMRAAISAYMDEAFKPGPIVELSTADFVPIPQRDYRKEVWIAHWAAVPDTVAFPDAVSSAQRAVKAFDEFFNEGTTP